MSRVHYIINARLHQIFNVCATGPAGVNTIVNIHLSETESINIYEFRGSRSKRTGPLVLGFRVQAWVQKKPLVTPEALWNVVVTSVKAGVKRYGIGHRRQ